MLAAKINLLSLVKTLWEIWLRLTLSATHASNAFLVVLKRLERQNSTNGPEISISAQAVIKWEKPSNSAKSAMKCGILKNLTSWWKMDPIKWLIVQNAKCGCMWNVIWFCWISKSKIRWCKVKSNSFLVNSFSINIIAQNAGNRIGLRSYLKSYLS